MKLAFVFNPRFVIEPINPAELLTSGRGLTGSEISFVEHARQMAARGHDVGVFTNVTADGVAPGIAELPFYRFRTLVDRLEEGWDAAISWLDPMPLRDFGPSVLKMVNQQVSDFHYAPGWERWVDVATALSITHREYLKRQTDFESWEIVPNGVDPSVFKPGDRSLRRREILWASSADRGLHLLLEMYPEIRRRVPDVELTICYSWDRLYTSLKDVAPAARGVGPISCRIRYIHEAVQRLADHGVRHLGSTSRGDLASIMRRAMVLGYTCSPVAFTESFSVTTLEAAASGCVPLITRADALGELYGNYVPTVPMPFESSRDEYADKMVQLLTDDAVWEAASKRCSEISAVYSWSAVGDVMENVLKKLI